MARLFAVITTVPIAVNAWQAMSYFAFSNDNNATLITPLLGAFTPIAKADLVADVTPVLVLDDVEGWCVQTWTDGP